MINIDELRLSVGFTYTCISRGVIMVRKQPDDSAQACSAIRPGQSVECLGLYSGVISKLPPAQPIRVDKIWMKIDKGYVRVVSLNGERAHFKLKKVQSEYPTCTTKNTQVGSTVMVKDGATNAYGAAPKRDFYAPAKHIVNAIDGTKSFILLGGELQGDGTWYKFDDCVLVDGNDLGK